MEYNWNKNVFLAQTENHQCHVWASCNQLGYNCDFFAKETFQYSNESEIKKESRDIAASVAFRLKNHVQNCHPNFHKGMSGIGKSMKKYGYGVIRNFTTPEVAWALNVYLAASGKEKEAIENNERISGRTIQVQVSLNEVKNFFTKTEPFINSHYWDIIKPFFEPFCFFSRSCSYLVTNIAWRVIKVLFSMNAQ